MQCVFFPQGQKTLLFACTTCTTLSELTKEKPICMMCLDGKQITALLDSGSVTLVKANLVTSVVSGQEGKVLCIHGGSREYPLVTMDFKTPVGAVSYPAGVVPKLLYDVIIGRNSLHFGNYGKGQHRLLPWLMICLNLH